ncbi:MAG: hypothetical protein K2R98_10505 [Gemmataceae bacterium]|nr:hypothetical protein [Gemmataceae bacterium]
MPVVIDCQSCGRKLRVTDDLIGRAVKCPTCGTTFDAVAPGAPSAVPKLDLAPPPEPLLERSSPPANGMPPPHVESDRDFRDCPACGRQVRREASRCRHCGHDMAESVRDDESWERGPRDEPVRRDSEPERGGFILTLGILSILLPVIGPIMGICAWIMGSRDLAKMRNGQMDARGTGSTQAGMICGIIGTFLEGIISLCCIGYFVMIFAMIASVGSMKPAAPATFRTVAPMTVRVPPKTITDFDDK